VNLGREMLERRFKKSRQSMPTEKEMDEVARLFSRSDADHLFFSVGCGELSSQQIFNKLHPSQAAAPAVKRKPARRAGATSGVTVQGMSNIMIRFSKCCQPVPGDDVVGLVTKGHGISVHRTTCHNVLKDGIATERLVSIDWETERTQAFHVDLSLSCEDRHSLLADVAKAISDEGANIVNADVRSGSPQSVGMFSLQVISLEQLEGVIRSISKVKGVHRVARKGQVSDG
jgi:guanosine-3',5'-bis(diphosphate) 3'-pyrophosphohydrolase